MSTALICCLLQICRVQLLYYSSFMFSDYKKRLQFFMIFYIQWKKLQRTFSSEIAFTLELLMSKKSSLADFIVLPFIWISFYKLHKHLNSAFTSIPNGILAK